MRNALIRPLRTNRTLLRFCSDRAKSTLRAVNTIRCSLETVELDSFRRSAFIPEKPILISSTSRTKSSSAGAPTQSQPALPAARKWFEGNPESLLISQGYLSPFASTILPYEYICDKSHSATWLERNSNDENARAIHDFLGKLSGSSSDGTFHHFHAPLSLFLQACALRNGPRLYIAQAQIIDLPKQLQEDLLTPKLVKEAGRGDVYDANLWMGIPPTYTPLHKDPNPNLFVQIAGTKRVRVFEPITGTTMYRRVQQVLGQMSSPTIRGDEMMHGPERAALDQAVWGQSEEVEGYEATVHPGDTLFIPKGWWHSIKSFGEGVNASVNWWFR